MRLSRETPIGVGPQEEETQSEQKPKFATVRKTVVGSPIAFIDVSLRTQSRGARPSSPKTLFCNSFTPMLVNVFL